MFLRLLHFMVSMFSSGGFGVRSWIVSGRGRVWNVGVQFVPSMVMFCTVLRGGWVCEVPLGAALPVELNVMWFYDFLFWMLRLSDV